MAPAAMKAPARIARMKVVRKSRRALRMPTASARSAISGGMNASMLNSLSAIFILLVTDSVPTSAVFHKWTLTIQPIILSILSGKELDPTLCSVSRPALCFFQLHRTDLEFRDLRLRIDGRIGQKVGRRFGEVEGGEDQPGPDPLRHLRLGEDFAAP